MPKLTLEERRRETLRRQLYGKEESVIRIKNQESRVKDGSNTSKTFSIADYKTTTPNSELLTANYLSKDLSKVLIFSVLAIGIQLTLFFLLQHNLVKLPF